MPICPHISQLLFQYKADGQVHGPKLCSLGKLTLPLFSGAPLSGTSVQQQFIFSFNLHMKLTKLAPFFLCELTNRQQFNSSRRLEKMGHLLLELMETATPVLDIPCCFRMGYLLMAPMHLALGESVWRNSVCDGHLWPYSPLISHGWMPRVFQNPFVHQEEILFGTSFFAVNHPHKVVDVGERSEGVNYVSEHIKIYFLMPIARNILNQI